MFIPTRSLPPRPESTPARVAPGRTRRRLPLVPARPRRAAGSAIAVGGVLLNAVSLRAILFQAMLLQALLQAMLLAGPADAQDRVELRTAVVQLIDRVELSAEDNGLLAGMHVEVGDEIEEGALLAELSTSDAQLLLEQATLELEQARLEADSMVEVMRAKQTLVFRQSDWTRADTTARQNPGAFSLSELDKKKLDWETAKLDVELAEEERRLKATAAEIKKNAVDRAQHLLDRRRLVAPISGTIERIERQKGEWVEAGQQVFLIVNPRRLRVRGLIKVTDFDPKLRGATASLRLNTPELRSRTLNGVVSFVSTENEPRTNDIRVSVDFDNPDNLVRPGMTAEVWIDRSALNSSR